MASNYNRDVSQYKYSAMSNLVLQADRRFVSRRKDEPTGDPESMAGRLKIQDMGSRIARDTAPKTKKTSAMPDVKRGDFHEGEDVLQREQRKRQGQALHGTSILGGADLMVEGLRYRPRTSATRATFELILSLVARSLGDVPHEVVRSAADAVLEYLKDDDLKDFDKKKEVDDILGVTMSPKEFNEIVNLGKKITDYDNQDDEDEEMADQPANDDEEIDERQGVAVDFEEDEDEDAIVNEVRDESSEDEDEEDRPEVAEEAAAGGAGTDRDEEELGFADADDILLDPSVSAAAGSGGKRSGGGANGKDENAVPARDIDAYWLQRQIGKLYPDAHTQHDKTREALRILSGEPDEAGGEEKELHEIENEMMELFDYEHPEMAQKLIDNREKIVWLTKLARAENDEERGAIEREMASEGLRWILNELQGKTTADASKKGKMEIKMNMKMEVDAGAGKTKEEEEEGKGGLVGGLQPRRTINLENLVFEQGNHLMTNPRVSLPEGSTKRVFKGYEEIHVPPPKKRSDPQDANIPIVDLPEWAQRPFSTTKTLNRIQSRCYESAFGGDGNMLVCAPTGSGKTNVSMLTILREIGKNRDAATGEIDLDAFKIVYIAPLKALVQEQVGNFGKRLEPYGVSVRELTGDRQLTKQQIAETQVIVTTPEKWDVITRKATDMSYTNLVRLIIIDEIHLLHDDRGPVLESIVSRTLRRTEQTGEPVRLVGLSATLPNYRDVGSFLRVDVQKDLFHFDGSYRPCPLRQEFIGVTERRPIKQLKTMNDITYAKVLEHVGQKRNQMLIFVHSRKDTAKTARYIRDKAVELETINQILKHDAGSVEVLREAAEQATDRELKDLLPYGFGIHHAGMSRADRTDVEDLFAQGAIQVLCCTATLAWGVNLPAHTVIIKGTQVYSPERGSWVELSPQDVLQMLGRAGRPQFDTYGEGIIVTAHTELPYYLSLLNQQLPIESQFVSRLVDNLNAEVVLGNVRTRDEAVEWLGYTYLFVRMLRSPGLYQVGAEYEDDAALEQKRVDLVHAAAVVLRRTGLARYDERTGRLQATELGRIASHYYITHGSMETYNSLLQPSVTTIELFRIFALSAEFKYIPVRQEEKLELAKLLGRVPIPVKESIEESHAKINVLLQAYISRLRLDGLALMADMVYVTQSAGRILRAIFEMALKKGWAQVARTALDLCKMAEKRMWPTMTPLRQFGAACPREVVGKAERIDVPWARYFGLDAPRMGELLGLPPKTGAAVCRLVSQFPRLQLQAQVLPVTRSLLRISLAITPDFTWDETVHGAAEAFWIIVEDCDGEDILYHDQFLLRREFAESENNEHIVDLTVPIGDPLPPNYFVSVVSDRWMHSETRLALPFHKLLLPDRFPPHTELLELQPLPVASALKAPEHAALYPGWTHFNRIQTQTFNSLFATDHNVLVGAATGSGKTVCAEFALLRLWASAATAGQRAVYVAPLQELVDVRFQQWEKRFNGIGGGKQVSKLTGDVTMDLRLLSQADLVLATPAQWDALARDWPRRKAVQAVGLLVADDLHMVGSSAAQGHAYEVMVSRMGSMRQQLEAKGAQVAAAGLRIVGLCVSLANAREMGDWIGATKHDIYNFSPQVRPVPLELHLQSYSVPHFPSLMLAMARPAYLAITQLSAAQPALLFVPSRKQTRATARDLLLACAADEGEDDNDRFLHVDPEQLGPLLARVQEPALREALSHGVAYYHEALSATDKRIARHLFANGAVQVMVASRDVCWELEDCTAHLVIVMGTQHFDGREHRYVDYALSEVLQMFGRALRPDNSKAGGGRSRGVLMLPAVKREYYKKFLNEALPVESLLHDSLADAFMTEISVRAIRSGDDALDWLTRTLFYRRLLANPSYYGLSARTEDAVGQFLTTLVEDTLVELRDTHLVEIDEDEEDGDGAVQPQNGASVATYYNLSYVTMQTLLLSLTARTKLKGMLEIVTAAAEFEAIQTRRHEERLLQRIYDRVPVKMADPDVGSAAFKAFVLLQAHFSRMQLPVDLARDQELVVARVPALLSATADLLASQGHLNALQAMEMTQMVVQAMWDRDSPLKQIPHFTPEVIKVATRYGIKDIFDFIDKMNPEENDQYANLVRDLGLTQTQLVEAAHFTNDKYPDVSLDFEIENEDDLRAGEPMTLKIKLEREGDDEDEDEDDAVVHAPFFPGRRLERWWLVVGEERNKSLLAIKRTFVGRKPVELRLPVELPEPGEHTFKLYLMSDSYVGVDQDPSFTVKVAEGMDEDSSEEESDNNILLSRVTWTVIGCAGKVSYRKADQSGSHLPPVRTTAEGRKNVTRPQLLVLQGIAIGLLLGLWGLLFLRHFASPSPTQFAASYRLHVVPRNIPLLVISSSALLTHLAVRVSSLIFLSPSISFIHLFLTLTLHPSVSPSFWHRPPFPRIRATALAPFNVIRIPCLSATCSPILHGHHHRVMSAAAHEDNMHIATALATSPRENSSVSPPLSYAAASVAAQPAPDTKAEAEDGKTPAAAAKSDTNSANTHPKDTASSTMTDVAADAKAAAAPAAAQEKPTDAPPVVEAPAVDADKAKSADGEIAADEAKPDEETRDAAAPEADAPAKEDGAKEEAGDAAGDAAEDAAAATTSTPANPPKASSASRRKSAGPKLNRKASKARITHLDAKPGEHYFVKLKGYPAWPVIVCDEEMLPQTLIKSRPVSAARPDGTYREDYADGGKRASDRTFPVMYLYTNEFGWVPNQDMHDLDPTKVLEVVNDKMRKDLQQAHKLAAESNPLEHYKEMLRQFQEDLEQAEEAKRQAQATPKKVKKAANKDGDIDMLDVPLDDDEEEAVVSKKSAKKRKAEDERTLQRSDSVKKPKIKITSSGTPKNGGTNGATASKSAKPKPKKADATSAPAPATEESVLSPEELSPEEKLRRKTKEVYFLRHKIQKSLLTRDQEPKADEMKLISDYLTKLEGFANLEVSIIRETKINKVLKAILKIETIPREDEFKFKPRSHTLLDKWSKLLASADTDKEAEAAKGETNGASTNGSTAEAKKEVKANGAKDEADKAGSEPPKESEKPKEEPAAVEASA